MNNDQTSGHEVTIRDALIADVPLLAQADSLAAAGNAGRRTAIQRWVATARTREARAGDRVTGYCVTEYTF